jgi:hypothetical protein
MKIRSEYTGKRRENTYTECRRENTQEVKIDYTGRYRVYKGRIREDTQEREERMLRKHKRYIRR